MFSDDRVNYSVLTRPVQNTRWSLLRLNMHELLIVCIILVPGILLCLCSILIFEYYPVLLYPRANYGVDERNIHRALLYSDPPTNLTSADYQLSFVHKPHLKSLKSFKLVCYYNFPENQASVQVKDLDPFLCTHINAAFAKVRNNTIFFDGMKTESLKELVRLKEINKDLKILISVGGAGNKDGFPEMVFNHSNRKSFIKSLFECKETYNIDGVDIDWEFPNEDNDEDKKQKMHFTQLLEEFRHAIDRREDFEFLVTVAVAAPYFLAKNSYDVAYMNEFIDFVNLMSYDYHFYTKSTPFTGHNSPLYPSGNEMEYLATLNINYSTNFWNNLGMDTEKIVVGLPTYGHSFRLVNPDNNSTYAPASGYGKLGTSGFACYTDICSFLTKNFISPIFDTDAKSLYASCQSEWVSFDNVQSLTFKAEFIKNNNLGGAMVYSLNCDDFKQKCEKKGKRFPLINSIKNVLFG